MSKWTDNLTPVEWREQTPSNYTAGSPFSNVTATIQGSNAGTLSPITLAKRGPYVNLGSDTAICQGYSLTLDAGNPGYDYQWSTGDTTQQITVSNAGTYSVTVTNPISNCSSTDNITIQLLALPDAQITSTNLSFCNNEANPTLQATPAGGVWSGQGINPTTGTINLASLTPGNYTITYTATNQCGNDKDSVLITVKESPSVSASSIGEHCQGANDGKAWVTIVGNNAPYSIVWSNGASTDTITMLIPGTYSVVVTGANGCKSGDTTIVNGSSDECYITHIFIPNIFSPNGDGNNDAFQVYGAGIKNIEIHIFDRWGIEVFSATTLNEKWDGTYKGKFLDPAVFTYYITVEFYNGDLKNFTGTVTLVR